MRHGGLVCLLGWFVGLAACGPSAPPAHPVTDSPCERAHELDAAGRLDEALAAASACAAAAPDDPAALDVHGELLLAAGRLDEAERVFTAAAARPGGAASGYGGLAVVRFHRGDADGGRAALDRALTAAGALAAGDPFARIWVLENLAWAQLLAGDEAGAFDSLAASVAAQGLAPALSTAVDAIGRARLHLHLGRWDQAIAEAARARAGAVPPRIELVSRALEASARTGAGQAEQAAALIATFGADADRAVAATAELDLALAQGERARAAALVTELEGLDRFAAEVGQLALAQAQLAAGDPAAAGSLARLRGRYLRSVRSAYLRRTAERLAAAPR